MRVKVLTGGRAFPAERINLIRKSRTPAPAVQWIVTQPSTLRCVADCCWQPVRALRETPGVVPVPVPVDDVGRGALERRCTVLSEDRSTAGLHAPAPAVALALARSTLCRGDGEADVSVPD